jgi:uncharacterized membrane protein
VVVALPVLVTIAEVRVVVSLVVEVNMTTVSKVDEQESIINRDLRAYLE